MWASTLALAAERRIALVIGNASYQQGPLRNPVNDARDMRAQLLKLGFAAGDIVYRENLKTREVGPLLRELRSRLQSQPGAVALVFYAGHGVQMRGENYFPTVDATIEGEDDLPLQSLRLGSVLDALAESKTRLNLLLLDACRNNPYKQAFRSGTRGLGRVDGGMPSGTLIAYATRPNDVAADGNGRNGVFTQALLQHMPTPGQPVEQMLKRVAASVETLTAGRQEPWVEGSIRGDFFVAGQGNAVAGPVASPAGVSLDDLEREDAERQRWAQWQTQMQAEFSKVEAFRGAPDLKIKAWERYLQAWADDNPGSSDDERLRAMARERMAQLQAPVPATAVTAPTVRADGPGAMLASSPAGTTGLSAGTVSAAATALMNLVKPELLNAVRGMPQVQQAPTAPALQVEYDLTKQVEYTGKQSRTLPQPPATNHSVRFVQEPVGAHCDLRVLDTKIRPQTSTPSPHDQRQEFLSCGGFFPMAMRFGSAMVQHLTAATITGEVFPLQAGNRFQANLRYELGGSMKGESSSEMSCVVRPAIQAATLQPDMSGVAWPVECKVEGVVVLNGTRHATNTNTTMHYLESLSTFDTAFMLYDRGQFRLPANGVTTVIEAPGDYGSLNTSKLSNVRWSRP